MSEQQRCLLEMKHAILVLLCTQQTLCSQPCIDNGVIRRDRTVEFWRAKMYKSLARKRNAHYLIGNWRTVQVQRFFYEQNKPQ